MEVSGIEQAGITGYQVAVVQEMRELLQLQGELVVKLIGSSKVPGPSDIMRLPGLGESVDFHI